MFDILAEIKYYRQTVENIALDTQNYKSFEKQQLHNQVLRFQKGFQENSLHEVIGEDKWYKCSP